MKGGGGRGGKQRARGHAVYAFIMTVLCDGEWGPGKQHRDRWPLQANHQLVLTGINKLQLGSPLGEAMAQEKRPGQYYLKVALCRNC